MKKLVNILFCFFILSIGLNILNAYNKKVFLEKELPYKLQLLEDNSTIIIKDLESINLKDTKQTNLNAEIATISYLLESIQNLNKLYLFKDTFEVKNGFNYCIGFMSNMISNEKNFPKYFSLHGKEMKEIFLEYKEIGQLHNKIYYKEIDIKIIETKLKELDLKIDKYTKNMEESF